MAMDVVRSCYAARMRFDPSQPDLWTNVEWFFCKPGAKVFPFYHRFASSHYDGSKSLLDQSLGEEDHEFPPWRRGDPPAAADGQSYCGPLAHFIDGCNLLNGPIQQRDVDGLLTCCGGAPAPQPDDGYLLLEDGTPYLLEVDASPYLLE
jgi:hypothetical protein